MSLKFDKLVSLAKGLVNMSGISFERKYWVLVALYAADGTSMSPIQLQKSIFLIGQKLDIKKDFYEFEPYDYGPFDVHIYQDAESLDELGLITIAYWSERRRRTYSITTKGVEKIEELLEDETSEVVENSKEIVKRVISLGFRELVKEVYEEFPEYSINSVFRG